MLAGSENVAHGEARVTFGVRGKTGYDQNSRLTSAATRAANTQKNTRDDFTLMMKEMSISLFKLASDYFTPLSLVVILMMILPPGVEISMYRGFDIFLEDKHIYHT